MNTIYRFNQFLGRTTIGEIFVDTVMAHIVVPVIAIIGDATEATMDVIKALKEKR